VGPLEGSGQSIRSQPGVFARIRPPRMWRVVGSVYLLDPVAAEWDRLLLVIA
jgi:hypothetical protein